MRNKDTSDDPILQFLANTTLVTQAMQKSIHQALMIHKKLGNPVCESRNGEVVWIPPEEIPYFEVDK
jgi:hypothetical protein